MIEVCRNVQAIYEAYTEALKVSNALDFDDLLLSTARLLREHPNLCTRFQNVLVDEFQVLRMHRCHTFVMTCPGHE